METADAAAALVDGLDDAFGRAYADADAPFERWLRLADRSVRLRMVAPALAARFWPALAHLECEPAGTPALTISCWDREATGVAPPPTPWRYEQHLSRGTIRGQDSRRVRTGYDISMRMISAYDRDRREAFVHVADASLVSAWVDRAPFRTLIGWWADHEELVFLHASGVASRQRGVVLAGASGSGKSTTALACMAAGWQFLGDDVCLVRLEPDPIVFPVFALAKLERDALARLPALSEMIVDPDADQLVLDPADHRASSAPLRALVLPRVTGDGSTQIVAVDRRVALRTLVPASVLEGVGAGAGALSALGALLRRVPCSSLELGTDVDGVVAAMQRVADGTS